MIAVSHLFEELIGQKIVHDNFARKNLKEELKNKAQLARKQPKIDPIGYQKGVARIRGYWANQAPQPRYASI